jgi:hypothetical protein
VFDAVEVDADGDVGGLVADLVPVADLGSVADLVMWTCRRWCRSTVS